MRRIGEVGISGVHERREERRKKVKRDGGGGRKKMSAERSFVGAPAELGCELKLWNFGFRAFRANSSATEREREAENTEKKREKVEDCDCYRL